MLLLLLHWRVISMSNATHFNEISNTYYLVKQCGVYMLHNDNWRMSAFKQHEVINENGFVAL